MTTDLTERQAEALAVVDTYIKENKVSPTIREVAKGLGLKSPHPAYRLLCALYEKGYVTWTSEPRTLKVLKRPRKSRRSS